MPVLLVQSGEVVAVIFVASSGTVPGVTTIVSGVPAPQSLYPVTISVPVPEPTTGVIDEVLLEPDQPVPRTVHE